MIKIAVITKVPEPDANDKITGGNLANALPELYEEVTTPDKSNDYLGTYKRASSEALFNFMTTYHEPAFYLSEILILNDLGREIGYPGRKPDKWLVEYEVFETLEEAVTVAENLARDS